MLRMWNLNQLGYSNYCIGNIEESIDFYQQGLKIARDAKDRGWESTFLGHTGLAYTDLGDRQAVEFYEQSLVISREIGDRRGEAIDLSCLGRAYADLGETHKSYLIL